MEIKDLNEVSLKDTGFYETQAPYAGTFRKYNVTTVAKLLDKNLMKVVLEHVKDGTKEAIESLIKLVEFKYLNISLGNEDFLNYKIIGIDHDWGIGFGLFLEDGNGEVDSYSCVNLICGMPYGFQTAMLIRWNKELEARLNDSSLRVIDALKILAKPETYSKAEYRVVLNIIKANVESYEKKNGTVDLVIDPKAVDILNGKITELIKEKNALDMQILSLVRERDKIKAKK